MEIFKQLEGKNNTDGNISWQKDIDNMQAKDIEL
jgi:hypothetical protein